MKRVMVDQGNTVEIMYPDIYKGLSLRVEETAPKYEAKVWQQLLYKKNMHPPR